MDPPRKGAHPEVLKAIAGAQPERVVYISCHPASQARDAAVLKSAGYTATLAQPFDMFPQTAEIENVITFERNRP
jgi:23S rRNA (uracil1939-C5)-methyltransferase